MKNKLTKKEHIEYLTKDVESAENLNTMLYKQVQILELKNENLQGLVTVYKERVLSAHDEIARLKG